MRRSIVVMALWPIAAVLAACPDTGARLDEFNERSEPYRVEAVAGECTGVADLTGDYMLAILTTVDPSPILMFAGAEVDTGANTITISMTPLTTDDRTLVGDTFTATSDLDDVGAFVLDFGEITVPGEANPIIPGVPATAEITLVGCTSTVDSTCGAVEGRVTSPAEVPLDGSSFGVVPVAPEEDLTEVEAVLGCPEPEESEEE